MDEARWTAGTATGMVMVLQKATVYSATFSLDNYKFSGMFFFHGFWIDLIDVSGGISKWMLIYGFLDTT